MGQYLGRLDPQTSIHATFLWGHMKNIVYRTPVANIGELRERIMACAQDIRNDAAMLQRVSDSFERRANACIQQNSSHFEPYL